MAKDSKQEGSGTFFVQIRDTSEIKRNILESLKQILSILQRFESLKHARQQKLEKMQRLRILVRDSNRLMGTLRSKFPQAGLRGLPQKEEEKKPAKKIKEATPKKEKKEAPAKESQPKKKTELERLESELSAIESKLKSFS